MNHQKYLLITCILLGIYLHTQVAFAKPHKGGVNNGPKKLDIAMPNCFCNIAPTSSGSCRAIKPACSNRHKNQAVQQRWNSTASFCNSFEDCPNKSKFAADQPCVSKTSQESCESTTYDRMYSSDPSWCSCNGNMCSPNKKLVATTYNCVWIPDMNTEVNSTCTKKQFDSTPINATRQTPALKTECQLSKCHYRESTDYKNGTIKVGKWRGFHCDDSTNAGVSVEIDDESDVDGEADEDEDVKTVQVKPKIKINSKSMSDPKTMKIDPKLIKINPKLTKINPKFNKTKISKRRRGGN